MDTLGKLKGLIGEFKKNVNIVLVEEDYSTGILLKDQSELFFLDFRLNSLGGVSIFHYFKSLHGNDKLMVLDIQDPLFVTKVVESCRGMLKSLMNYLNHEYRRDSSFLEERLGWLQGD